jgi:acyl carrier protein
VGVADKVVAIIVDGLGVDPSTVTGSASFTDDLGADSLALTELTMAIEEEFGIDIPDEDAENIGTVEEAIAYVMGAASRPPAPTAAAEAPEQEADDAEPAVDVAAEPVAAGDDSSDTTVYAVVVNHEEQYRIWPVAKEVPAGWRAVGPEGTKADCMAYIGERGTDLRPVSLRQKMGD